MNLHPDDEIVVTMSESDWDFVRTLFTDAFEKAQRKHQRKKCEKIREAVHRICHTAETLSLTWIDRKLEEFQ